MYAELLNKYRVVYSVKFPVTSSWDADRSYLGTYNTCFYVTSKKTAQKYCSKSLIAYKGHCYIGLCKRSRWAKKVQDATQNFIVP